MATILTFEERWRALDAALPPEPPLSPEAENEKKRRDANRNLWYCKDETGLSPAERYFGRASTEKHDRAMRQRWRDALMRAGKPIVVTHKVLQIETILAAAYDRWGILLDARETDPHPYDPNEPWPV